MNRLNETNQTELSKDCHVSRGTRNAEVQWRFSKLNGPPWRLPRIISAHEILEQRRLYANTSVAIFNSKVLKLTLHFRVTYTVSLDSTLFISGGTSVASQQIGYGLETK